MVKDLELKLLSMYKSLLPKTSEKNDQNLINLLKEIRDSLEN